MRLKHSGKSRRGNLRHSMPSAVQGAFQLRHGFKYKRFAVHRRQAGLELANISSHKKAKRPNALARAVHQRHCASGCQLDASALEHSRQAQMVLFTA